MQKNRREFMKKSLQMGALAMSVSTLSSLSAKELNEPKSTQSQVWYITGASGGLGLALAKYLLEKGDKVAATSRNLKNIEAKLGKQSENFLPLQLRFDENLHADIQGNLKAIQEKFGRLDNVVNNAGYGLLGFVEETSEKQLREQFEVNVFAPFLICQNALKIMRPQAIKEGGNAKNTKARIFNLSSIGGFRVSNVSTPYCTSKFAISALSEGLGLDLEDFGISVINVMPAGFRTEFVGTSMILGDTKISAYDTKREAFLQRTSTYNGKQAGDPSQFAQILYKLSREAKPVNNLFMGAAAYNSARNKIALVESEMRITEPYAGANADFKDAGDSAFDKR